MGTPHITDSAILYLRPASPRAVIPRMMAAEAIMARPNDILSFEFMGNLCDGFPTVETHDGNNSMRTFIHKGNIWHELRFVSTKGLTSVPVELPEVIAALDKAAAQPA